MRIGLGLGVPIQGVSSRGVRPSMSLDFTTGTYDGATPANINSTGGYAQSLDGTWSSFAANALRRTNKGLLVEPSAKNWLASSGGNATVGTANGTNSPSGWAVSSSGGLTAAYTGNSTIGGIAGTSLRISGTPSGSFWVFRFGVVAALVASQPKWACAASFQLVGGSFTNISSAQFGMGSTNGGTLTPTTTIDGTVRRYEVATTIGGDANVDPRLALFTTAGLAIDITIWIGGVMFVDSTTVGSYYPTTTATLTRSADAVSFEVPAGMPSLTYTFSDDSTQVVAVSSGSYTVPTDLAPGKYIKSIAS